MLFPGPNSRGIKSAANLRLFREFPARNDLPAEQATGVTVTVRLGLALFWRKVHGLVTACFGLVVSPREVRKDLHGECRCRKCAEKRARRAALVHLGMARVVTVKPEPEVIIGCVSTKMTTLLASVVTKELP